MSQIQGKPQVTQAKLLEYRNLRQECAQIQAKIGELEMELNEHQLVIESLGGLEGGRKAFHLIGGVLVEQTVSEILPAVTANKDGIVNLLAQMEQLLKQKGDAALEIQEKYGLNQQQQVKQQKSENQQQSNEIKAAGVLA
mmetsp:Transcript_27299/g.35806  ORF Transcript_27299/g.35806 Transcript_27299/m.35806 type:complete len:140 (+) Transcript_27299:99-518(+)